MMNKATCKIVLDTKSKEPEKRLYLSVTYQRQAYKYSLGLNFKLTKEQFENKNLKITKEALAAAEPEKMRAEQIVNKLGQSFSFSKFKSRFKGKDKTDNDSVMSDKLDDVLKHYIENKHDSLAQGTIDSYNSAINHLTAYSKNVRISDLTVPFLQSFITHLKHSKGISSEATINIYLRAIKAIYNYAEVMLCIDPRNNPFGRNKIEIHSNTNVKKAINENDFQKLLTYKPADSKEEFAHDMFLLSFGLIGMNIADILSIKNRNIDKQTLRYDRKKTKNRKKTPEPIKIEIEKPTMKLIKKHGVINPDAPDDYIFPFLKVGMSDKQELRKRKDITKLINKSLDEICKKLEIEKFTYYAARHTIATMLMNDGTSVEAISKSLGHSNIKVTQNYLSQLSDKVAKDVAIKVSSYMTPKTIEDDSIKSDSKELVVIESPIMAD
jgi:integrase